MDTEEIQIRIVNLGRESFRSVVEMILVKVFLFPALNVDGKRDGGVDWWVFTTGGHKVRLAIQDTVQFQNWEEKALADAKKAAASHAPNRFVFCTNRAHTEISVTSLENQISQETGMAATVLEASKLARLIQQGHLEDNFLIAIGEQVPIKRPDMPEMALCVYSNISADRTNHRNEIYSDTLLVFCREHQPIDREELIQGAMGFLGSAAGQRQLVDRRIDMLLSSRHIIRQKEDGKLVLASEIAKKLEQTERLYLSDWKSLTGAQTALLAEYGGRWNERQAEFAAICLTRMFLQEQLKNLKAAGADILTGSWMGRLGDPRQRLRDLLQECGVPIKELANVIGKLVELARNREVVSKLTRTAVFAALEGRDPLQSARTLGASGWDEVAILLDASVAIPLLCAKRTEPVNKYIYGLSSSSVEVMVSLGASMRISAGHLEECASHLLRAFRYEPVEQDADFALALRTSDNAFVAFYYALRSEGRRAPASLLQFLQVFSRTAPRLVQQNVSVREAARLVMPDLQEGFSDYDVWLEQLSRVSFERFESIGKAYDLAWEDERRTKVPVLRRHDLDVLAHLEARVTMHHEPWMLFTWDRFLIRFAAGEIRGSWVVSPEVAMDFAQPCRRLTETEWCTLAHRLARVSDPKDVLTANIIDRVVRLRHDRLQDWEFKDRIRQYRDEALSRLPISEEASLHEWIEKETDAFIKENQLEQPPVVAAENGDQGTENQAS